MLFNCLLCAGSTYGSARVGARYGPAGLGDPDPFAGRDTVNGIAGGLDRVPEDVGSVADGSVLEVGVARRDDVSWRIFAVLFQDNSPVHADEVTSLDDDVVRAINPRSPGVDVTDLGLHTDRAHHTSHIVDAVGKGVGVAVLPVQVLAADGDGNDPVLAVSRDGIEQGLLLGVEVVGIFSPDTDEDLGAGVEGGGDGIGEGVAIRSRVEANGCHVLGESLQFVECGGPLGGGLAGAISIVGTDVDTLPVC